jgi:hypothetical protein
VDLPEHRPHRTELGSGAAERAAVDLVEEDAGHSG